MKRFQLCYKTNVVASIMGYDSLEDAKSVIENLTKNATRTEERFGYVEFFVSDSDTDEVLFTSPRYGIGSVEDIDNLENLLIF